MEPVKQDDIIDLLINEDYPGALHMLQQYLIMNPKDEFYYKAAIEARMGLEDYHGALHLVQEAEEAGLESAELLEQKGEVCLLLEDYDQALETAERCLQLSQEGADEPALFLKGRAQLGKEDCKGAASTFEDILLETDDPDTRMLLAVAYESLGKVDRMIENLDAIISDPDFHTRIFTLLIEHNDFDLLNHYLFSVYDYDDARICLWYSQYYMHYGELVYAADCLYDAATLLKDEIMLAHAAFIYARNERQTKARKLFRQLINIKYSRSAHDPVEYVTIRLALLAELDYTKGWYEKYFRMIMDKAPHNPKVRLQAIADVLDHGDADLARELLAKWKFPKNCREEVQLLQARVYLLGEEYDEAYTLLSQHHHPGRTWKKNLAVAAFNTHRDDEALSLAKELMPDGSMAIIAMLVYERKQDPQKAAGILKQIMYAQKSGQDVPELNAFLEFLMQVDNTARS